MKLEILQILRSRDEPVSGEDLSHTLAVSRVAVWKHINRLKELGYGIEASSRGYRLTADPDIPYPWEFSGRRQSVHYFDEVASTMDIARELARKGAPHMTVVAAGRQLSGRGRLMRSWQSEPGGLYFTVILRPDIAPPLACRVTFAAGAALAKVLRELFGIEALLKWPNDVLIDGKKLSGMLSEMETHSDMLSFVNLGIGINVNNDPSGIVPPAVSLKALLRRQVSKVELLSKFLDAFETLLGILDDTELLAIWRSLSGTLGRQVQIASRDGVVSGRAVDIDESGALLVETNGGGRVRMVHGDCLHGEFPRQS